MHNVEENMFKTIWNYEMTRQVKTKALELGPLEDFK
jgi:hypothetical protein